MERQVFVARERELGQLDSFLNRALDSQGKVCFVTGEAGSGKTALVTEFARRAQEQHKELVVAVGQCDAQTGIGDAYLPFREVLSQLTGDVEAELARGAITQENASRLRGLLRFSGKALVDVGPDLLGLFVPGAGLASACTLRSAFKWPTCSTRYASRGNPYFARRRVFSPCGAGRNLSRSTPEGRNSGWQPRLASSCMVSGPCTNTASGLR